MKKNTILLSSLLATLTLSLASCNQKPHVPTEQEKKEAVYKTFKDTVMKEFNYKDSKTLNINAEVKSTSVEFSGVDTLTNDEIKSLAESTKPMNMNIVKNSSYDKNKNIYTKSTIDQSTKEAKLEEFYYVENNKEYKCYIGEEFDFDKFETVEVKKREKLDNGHMDTVTSMKPAKQIEVLTNAKTFDELLTNATNMMGDFSKLIKDFKVNDAKVETKDTETGHEAKLTASLQGDILGAMKFDANLVGTLNYTDERIESFVVTGNGSLTTKTTKGEKEYSIKQNLAINANILLKREATELVPAKLIDEYKAIAATDAKKQSIKATSILGNSKLTIGEVGSDLPFELKGLKHCDIKVYKDDTKKEEVALNTLEQKTFAQSVYIDIVPQENYALLIETQKDPSGYEMHTVKKLELTTLNNAKYEYLKTIQLESDWGNSNGKNWTNTYLNGEKVSDTTVGLTLESGKIYKVEYEFIENTNA